MSGIQKPVKYLIIRFSSIGDIVLTTPVIRNLKQQSENAEVHYLTKKNYSSILQHNPYIDKLHLYDNDFNGLIKQLKAEEFDYIIDLHRNIRTSRVKRALKTISFSFDKLNFKKWLLVNFKINKMPKVHIVERYLETIRFFIDEPDTKGLDFFISESETVQPLTDEKYAVVVLGANHYTKQVPDSKLIEICKGIEQPVVLIGGKDEIEKAEKIEKEVNKKLINLCGKLNINQSASVIKDSEWVITPDTGMMHIAAAYSKKIISIWGNTVPEFGMYPYKPHSESLIIQQSDLSCRPCSKIGFKECPKKHFKCMNNINVEKILSKIQK